VGLRGRNEYYRITLPPKQHLEVYDGHHYERASLDDKVGQAARSVRNQAAETSEGVQAVADTFYMAIKTSLKRQPMTTLGFAVAMGFVLGALWKA
jgi:ElaB/YqjD/DUF883 family membrane-anchored ribosome-binding protein